MDETSKDGRSSKTPEQIRAERIAEIGDPKVRQELDGLASTRDADLAQVRASQVQNNDKRVRDLTNLKMRDAHAPQLTPPGMRSPYLGENGRAIAASDAKAEIQTLDYQYLNNRAKEHNDQIDKRLDAHRENQAGRDLSGHQPSAAVPQHESVTTFMSRAPNRYAVIDQQNYAERAKKQAELDREKEQDPVRQQQRQRGLQR